MGDIAVSVINKMLQEIEERHDESAQKGMPGVVRAVPGASGGARWKRIGLIVLLLAASAAVAVAYWRLVPARKPAPIVNEHRAPTLPSVAAPATPPAVAAPAAPATDEPQLQASVALSTPVAAPAEPPAMKPAPPAQAEPVKPLVKARDEAPPPPAPVEKTKPAPKADADKLAGIKQMSPAQRIDYRYREALSSLAQGRPGEAQTAFEEVLKLDPRHAGARQGLLAIHIEAKRYAAAEQLLREGLQLGITPAAYAMTLARLQVEQGEQTAALATLDQYAPQGVGDAEYAGFHGALLQRANRHAEAIPEFQTAVKLRPNQGSWWLALGVSLQATQRNAEAEQAYQRALDTRGLTAALQALANQRLSQLRNAH